MAFTPDDRVAEALARTRLSFAGSPVQPRVQLAVHATAPADAGIVLASFPLKPWESATITPDKNIARGSPEEGWLRDLAADMAKGQYANIDSYLAFVNILQRKGFSEAEIAQRFSSAVPSAADPTTMDHFRQFLSSAYRDARGAATSPEVQQRLRELQAAIGRALTPAPAATPGQYDHMPFYERWFRQAGDWFSSTLGPTAGNWGNNLSWFFGEALNKGKEYWVTGLAGAGSFWAVTNLIPSLFGEEGSWMNWFAKIFSYGLALFMVPAAMRMAYKWHNGTEPPSWMNPNTWTRESGLWQERRREVSPRHQHINHEVDGGDLLGPSVTSAVIRSDYRAQHPAGAVEAGGDLLGPGDVGSQALPLPAGPRGMSI